MPAGGREQSVLRQRYGFVSEFELFIPKLFGRFMATEGTKKRQFEPPSLDFVKLRCFSCLVKLFGDHKIIYIELFCCSSCDLGITGSF